MEDARGSFDMSPGPGILVNSAHVVDILWAVKRKISHPMGQMQTLKIQPTMGFTCVRAFHTVLLLKSTEEQACGRVRRFRSMGYNLDLCLLFHRVLR